MSHGAPKTMFEIKDARTDWVIGYATSNRQAHWMITAYATNTGDLELQAALVRVFHVNVIFNPRLPMIAFKALIPGIVNIPKGQP